jgi:ribonuclease VapC
MRENERTADQVGVVVHEFLEAASIKVVIIGETLATSSAKAFEKFGEGRRPENLNLGDCFAYAAARADRAPLLFKGDDFSRTDVKTVKL